MPGICGIIDHHQNVDVAEQLPRMMACLRHHDWYVEDHLVDSHVGLGLGRVSLGFLNTGPQPARSADGRFLVVMDGEFYDAEQFVVELKLARHGIGANDQAAILAAGFGRDGTEFLARLDGSFAAAIWDGHEKRLHLISDGFGTRPFYYAHKAGRVVFGSQLKSLLVDPDVSHEPSAAGIAQFFTFGHYLRNDSSLEDVRVLPAAACLTFGEDSGPAVQEKYWRPHSLDGARDRADWLARIDAAFARAVERSASGTAHLGLSLSGGLDARSVLGAIDHDRVKLKTVCLGMPGSRDHRAAEQLAATVGCEHHNHLLGGGFLEDFEQHLNQMIRLTDGQYLSQCIVMPTLPLYRELDIQVLLRGHAGELMHMTKAYNYSLDASAMAISDRAGLEQWLFSHLQAYMLDGVQRPLFTSRYQEAMGELARQAIRDDLDEVAGVEPPIQQIWQLFVSQRLRRETTLSLLKFRSVVEPRLPYLDRELVELLLSAPPELKLDETIQTHILRKRRPEFCHITNVNTGTRLGAARWQKKLATLRMRVFAKLGMPGYQPYERLGLWLRRELADLVRSTLQGPECRARGIFVPRGVDAVIDRHFAKQANHTYLILAMMIFELAQRHLSGSSELTQSRPAKLTNIG